MLTTLLGVAAVVCAIGWLKNRLALSSILYYIMWAELPEPSDEEIKSVSYTHLTLPTKLEV